MVSGIIMMYQGAPCSRSGVAGRVKEKVELFSSMFCRGEKSPRFLFSHEYPFLVVLMDGFLARGVALLRSLRRECSAFILARRATPNSRGIPRSSRASDLEEK